jgi:hypothetical protein
MRMDNINKNSLAVQGDNQEVGKLLNKNTTTVDGNTMPEHIAAFSTAKTIPSYFTEGDCLPPKLAIPTAVD